MTMPLVQPPCEAAAARAAAETPGCAAHAKPWVLAASVLASSVVFLEATVINVALPEIQRSLDAPVATMLWIANCYTLALASLTLVGAALGDRRGRRRMLLVGLTLFSGATILTGFAANHQALIAGRLLQGVAAALVAPNSLSLLGGLFPRAERGRALGIWSAAAALTGGLAPLLGGWLVDTVSWRAVFLIGVPPSLLALTVIAARVPESRAPGGGAPLDLPGAALAALAFATLTAGLIAIARGGTDALGLLLLGGALLAAFLWTESRVRSPMVPLGLFRARAFAAANLLTLLVYFALAAAFFLLPFALVQGYGYSAAETGAVFLPFAAAMMVLATWGGGRLDRWGARPPLVLGPMLTAAGLALLAWPFAAGAAWLSFAPAMTLVGSGMALTAPAVTAVVMGAVDLSQTGVAAGVNNTVARLAGLLAVAVAGAVALAVFGDAVRQRVGALDVPPALRDAVLAERRDLGDAAIPPDAGAAAAPLVRAIQAALIDAFGAVALLAAACAFAGAGVAAVALGGVATAAAAPADAPPCEHLVGLAPATPRSDGCDACRRTDDHWIHLRFCVSCGHVGCCDASTNQHALRHFRTTGHPVVQSLATGESWRWCYLDETTV